jgi:hypothetical protein
VLKDVFDFSAEEIAVMLSTTVGAIKSALHRGRASLEQTHKESPASLRLPSKELIDRVVAAFNARDVDGMMAPLLENVTLEVPGAAGVRQKHDLDPCLAFTSLVQIRAVSVSRRVNVITRDEQDCDRVVASVNRLKNRGPQSPASANVPTARTRSTKSLQNSASERQSENTIRIRPRSPQRWPLRPSPGKHWGIAHASNAHPLG